MENRGPGAQRKEGDRGHLDICQPLMKEFNLVENLKQPCLTGALTDLSSPCWRAAAVSMCCGARGVIPEDASADACQSGFLPASALRNIVFGHLRQLSHFTNPGGGAK